MHVFDERARMRQISENFPNWVAIPHWGTGVWSKEEQQELLKKVEALNPETASPEDYCNILGTKYYVQPLSCDNCGEPSWDLVAFDQAKYPESRGPQICKACLTQALSLLK